MIFLKRMMCYGICWMCCCGVVFATWIDLTYPFNQKTLYWPTEKGFQLKKIFYGQTSQHYFYAAYRFCAPEHGGTHIDAPRHFNQQGHTVDQIPLSDLEGEALVIDVEKQVRRDRDYAITVQDIQTFEDHYRKIKRDDMVLFRTGWGQYWGNAQQYLGHEGLGDTKHLHFPGLSKEAAQYLVKKQVKAIGLDTPSLDPGPSQTFLAHRIILGANIYGIENIAHLATLPPLGARLWVAPLKIQGGSGAPVRLFATTHR